MVLLAAFSTSMLSWEEGTLIWCVCASAGCQWGLNQLTSSFSVSVCSVLSVVYGVADM